MMKAMILFLVIGLLIAATPVLAQGPGPVADWKAFPWAQYNREVFFAILENGDVYFRDVLSFPTGAPIYSGNFWDGVAIPTSPIKKWEFLEAGDRRAAIYVFLENGDVYKRGSNFELNGVLTGTPGDQYLGNFWTGAVSTSPQSWGGVKGKYQKRD